MEEIADGTYDVLVVDADEVGDDQGERGMRVEVVVVSGPTKGQVLALRAARVGRDPASLLGLPATLTVSDGRPALAFE